MAAPTATVNGTPVNFGFQGTNGITISAVSGTLLQSVDLSAMADCETTRDGVGAEVAHGWHNYHKEATLEWVVTGSGLLNAITNTTLLVPGAFISISACTSVPELIGNWEVQSGVKVTGSNTTSKKMSVQIKLLGGITAVAT